MDSTDEDIKILERALDSFADEYREQSEIWRTLEQKAQGLITGSGIFFAATFAFSREPSHAVLTKVLLLATLAALLFALLAALSVLQTSEFEIPDGSLAAERALHYLATPPAQVGGRLVAYLRELQKDTNGVLVSFDRVNSAKRERLATARRYFALAAYISVAATLINFVWAG